MFPDDPRKNICKHDGLVSAKEFPNSCHDKISKGNKKRDI